jgi:hypothetical protein
MTNTAITIQDVKTAIKNMKNWMYLEMIVSKIFGINVPPTHMRN